MYKRYKLFVCDDVIPFVILLYIINLNAFL